MKPKDLNLATMQPYFNNEDAAREFMEKLRWPNGPICPHCKAEKAYRLTPKPGSKTRKGVLKCAACRKQFTVKVGTIFEDSHIPLTKWLLAIYMICSSKKSISAHQIHRSLGITYKSAWFMAHRIRHAMSVEPLTSLLEGTIEADETYVGAKKPRVKGSSKRGRGTSKIPVVALVERGGRVRTKVVSDVSGKTLKPIIKEAVELSKSRLMTDEWPAYGSVGPEFANGHFRVNHSQKEYARGDVNTNTIEGFFALLKRGHMGAWHHVSKKHLPRYLNEFAFRWDHRKKEDGERTCLTIIQAEGKRLTYKQPVLD